MVQCLERNVQTCALQLKPRASNHMVLSIYLSIIYLFIYPTILLYIYLFIHYLSLYLSISIYLHIFYIYLYIYLSTDKSIYLVIKKSVLCEKPLEKVSLQVCLNRLEQVQSKTYIIMKKDTKPNNIVKHFPSL